MTPETMIECLNRLRRRSWIARSLSVFMAMRHGVRPSVEKKLALRGWVLSRYSLELLYTEQVNSVRPRCFCFHCHGYREIILRNWERRVELQKAETGARSSMPQVPDHWEG